MGPIRNPNWSTSGMRVTLSYLELHYCSYRDPISEKFNVTDGIRYLDFLHHKPTLSGINKKKSLHIYFNKNRHNMALSVRMGHGREKVISAYDFISLRRENLSNVWLWVQIDSNKYWQLKQININAMQNDAKC